VGRAASCTLVLDDDYASSRHARFFPREGRWYLEDLGSTNGTLVAGQRIGTPVLVPVGTPVRIGLTVIELRR
jgi:pSer/pThr/pTyr-binding forkhead associated (FHA) protein